MDNAQQKNMSRVLLCVALSVLLHALLGMLLLLLPPQEQVKRRNKPEKPRTVRVLRTAGRKTADEQKKQQNSPQEKKEESPQKPFAKTSADTPQRRPEQPEYEGSRDTRAASAPDAEHRRSDAHAPAQTGEEKEELVTFDQERQEGDLEHEGKRREKQHPPAPPVPPAPADQPRPPADGRPDAAPAREDADSGNDTATTQLDTTRSLTMTDASGEGLKLQQERLEIDLAELEQQAARMGAPDAAGKSPTAGARPRVFYDPSLAESRQTPGFRTYERRSRSSGRFVLGRGAALNVASTPRGMYEALIYRRIAHFWYIACDEHRGDIIPGKITISLRIDKRGRLDSMALIKRSGASISQQSFTFKAIRRASLPPMPPEVQTDVVGRLMELIFEFNFD